MGDGKELRDILISFLLEKPESYSEAERTEQTEQGEGAGVKREDCNEQAWGERLGFGERTRSVVSSYCDLILWGEGENVTEFLLVFFVL